MGGDYGPAIVPGSLEESRLIEALRYGNPELGIPPKASDPAIAFLNDVATDRTSLRRRRDFIQRMNQRLLDQHETDSRMEGMIHSLEMAFRRQTAMPDLVDLSKEAVATQKLHGIGDKATDRNGRACLLARRLSEAGVRFVQVTIDVWDHYGDTRENLPKSLAASDLPCAGLFPI
jgi:hypothetical protein